MSWRRRLEKSVGFVATDGISRQQGRRSATDIDPSKPDIRSLDDASPVYADQDAEMTLFSRQFYQRADQTTGLWAVSDVDEWS
jgi:hypothetical protein